ncbi:type 1 glutamine amidotransferase [Oceanicoccus sp. KOV_DT_Chl]|uniref:type 1 glutamine amidotransferase n=1 Tax=Oceanicoccus sp. KOV_DT_Chl TaxID=1904639 RepID=UPI00190ED6AA|nr:hypothetical protein [Oceanicoccus sp. KOV_DT_Chl]
MTFKFPPQVDVFHWHGETFTLPTKAILLAESAACKNQAFQIGRNVIGLQCHLETTYDSARAIVTHCGDELVTGEYIQAADDILATPEERYTTINNLMNYVLDYLHRSK